MSRIEIAQNNKPSSCVLQRFEKSLDTNRQCLMDKEIKVFLSFVGSCFVIYL